MEIPFTFAFSSIWSCLSARLKCAFEWNEMFNC
ncbi:MAG: hypothetical protein ACD_2C00066G0002 [uncultured bacterium (gcode 4)]|uniref:Uncharacterized protein n=1 Tax=uncultured bacterium (gcode 4) TaxID=1234023 RepID=K2G414_9BACT|nr:MAG: hypothetical protein ACD_2C00066G0002 [uncultured bacterium (gcode 4)]